jgi:hypothetical protein
MKSFNNLAMDSGFIPTIRPNKTLPAIPPKYPMHIVESRNLSSGGNDTGLTYSMEHGNNTAATAEYEVLKAIVSREQYLTRLQQTVRTVGKTFKPEIADVLDLYRMASLDVMEKIILWREAKVTLFKAIKFVTITTNIISMHVSQHLG